MKKNKHWFVSSMFAGVFALACSSSSTNGAPSPEGDAGTGDARPGAVTPASVVKGYAGLVHETYEASLDQMIVLQTAINAFVAAPSAAGLESAKAAWVKARQPYLQSEAFRFYGGPIDGEPDGPEGRINGWPLDEVYIDYVAGMPSSGIINAKTGGNFDVPAITKEVIKAKNEMGGDKNLSAGWHAIEFLLWGQDTNAAGPGARPYTDFVTGAGSTAANQDRRRAYLKAAMDLMVEDFAAVEEQWDVGTAGSYGAAFVAADPKAKIGDILKGMGSLAGAELPKERMNTGYETKDQEEEHSCFSDTTNQDIVLNGQGIENVYLAKFGSYTDASLSELVSRIDPALDAKMKSDLASAIAACKAIPAPFDQAILGADTAPGRMKLKAAIDAWTPVKDDVVAVATTLGVTINFD